MLMNWLIRRPFPGGLFHRDASCLLFKETRKENTLHKDENSHRWCFVRSAIGAFLFCGILSE